jgi:glutathionylspermidine synthase
LPQQGDWQGYFAPHHGVVECNPGYAILMQGKRAPLVWHRLEVPTAQWTRHLPETVDPRDRRWRADRQGWVLKPTWGRVGDGLLLEGVTDTKKAKAINWWSRFFPRDWIAQRRFVAAPIMTPQGPIYPCLGVYTINGRAAGVYGRSARRPLIDHRAQDVAVLLATSTNQDQQHPAPNTQLEESA